MAFGMVAKRRIKVGKNAEFEAAFVNCQNGVRDHEPGCTYYDLFHAADDPQLYFIVERYESRADIELHGTTDHVKAYWAAVAPLMDADLEVLKLDMVSPLR